MGTVYAARPIKRVRWTNARLQALDTALYDFADEHSEHGRASVTLRQLYYLAVVAGLVQKDITGYDRVQRRLSILRESGALPWAWISDNARVCQQYVSFDSTDEAIETLKATYRRNHWQNQPFRVEVWVESDAIASAIGRAVLPTCAPLYTCRGQSSKGYIWKAADDADKLGKPVHIVYVGDFDPSGLAIDRSLEERYRRYSDADQQLTVNRVAVTPEQIREYELPGKPAKTDDSNYGRFVETCEAESLPTMAVEAEALPPPILRQSVVAAINELTDPLAWYHSEKEEECDRERLESRLGHDGGHVCD